MTKKELSRCLELACQTLASMDELCVGVGAMDDKHTLDADGWMKDIISRMRQDRMPDPKADVKGKAD